MLNNVLGEYKSKRSSAEFIDPIMHTEYRIPNTFDDLEMSNESELIGGAFAR